MAQSTAVPKKLTSAVDTGTTYHTSWFFEKFGSGAQLPTLGNVLAIGAMVNRSIGRWMHTPPPVRFRELGIFVKWGEYVTPAEACYLGMLKGTLGNRVPVPELYGWHVQPADQQRGSPAPVFLYMAEIVGQTLKERYKFLQYDEKDTITRQLAGMIAQLRTLHPGLAKPYIGNVNGGPLLDISLESSATQAGPAGPFPDVKSFHDWFANVTLIPHKKGLPPNFQSPDRLHLPDNVPVLFTHADLNLSNIMISVPNQGPARIVALIDWHQSGWYPAYWEYHKALALSPGGYWEDVTLPAAMDSYNQMIESWFSIRACYGG